MRDAPLQSGDGLGPARGSGGVLDEGDVLQLALEAEVGHRGGGVEGELVHEDGLHGRLRVDACQSEEGLTGTSLQAEGPSRGRRIHNLEGVSGSVQAEVDDARQIGLHHLHRQVAAVGVHADSFELDRQAVRHGAKLLVRPLVVLEDDGRLMWCLPRVTQDHVLNSGHVLRANGRHDGLPSSLRKTVFEGLQNLDGSTTDVCTGQRALLADQNAH
mmetsp:Transcript_16138/g.56295  ORF Transcript_16138/g.56295 Transcript_16138/m.56295 type:complete len:215 (+) Transcript_16138:7317-7961(+)